MGPVAQTAIDLISHRAAIQGKARGVTPTELEETTGKPVNRVSIGVEKHHPNLDRVEMTGLRPPVVSHGSSTIGDVPITFAEIPRQESTKFTHEHVSEAARMLSALMDEKDEDIYFKICSGMSEQQLAEHFGSIGKQLDDALAEGEITQQEYDDLNRGLEQYTESMVGMAERETARWGVAKQCAAATRAMIEGGASHEEMIGYAQHVEATFRDQMDKFIEEICAIDRSLLAELIGAVRAGRSLP